MRKVDQNPADSYPPPGVRVFFPPTLIIITNLLHEIYRKPRVDFE